jgi:hypothetical protein
MHPEQAGPLPRYSFQSSKNAGLLPHPCSGVGVCRIVSAQHLHGCRIAVISTSVDLVPEIMYKPRWDTWLVQSSCLGNGVEVDLTDIKS